MTTRGAGEFDCDAVLTQLREGSFSALEPVVTSPDVGEPRIVQLHRDGCFAGRPTELAEALSCAAFVGAIEAMEYLLGVGVPPAGGSGTGLNALHWAANRGQLEAVRVLVRAGSPLEERNAYGGTVLGAAVYAAVHEAKPGHLDVIELLLQSGAVVSEAAYPSGDRAVDAMLSKFGARKSGRTSERLAVGLLGPYWALQFYQATTPTNELHAMGALGQFLLFLPVITIGLSISVFPAAGYALARDGGWRDRGPTFWVAQVLCLGFPLLVVLLLALLFLAVLGGLRV